MTTIAITGSASGIGAATKAALEAKGASIIGVDLRDAEVEADLSGDAGRQAAVSEVLERCGGKLDGLVTAAGLGPPQAANLMLSVNYFGTVALLEGLHGALAASDGIAKVVAVSSNSTTTVPNLPSELIEKCLAGDEAGALGLLDGYGDDAGNFAYACSKTAVARFVRRNATQEDWAGAGIRLNAIAPGATMTPLLQGGLDSDVFGPMIKAFPVPTGDFGTPEQLATWICHMMGDEADFLCGSVIFVDGGSDALLRPDAWPATYAV